MANTDTYEKDLGAKSAITSSDYIRVVGSDNVSYKQPMSYFPTKAEVDAISEKTAGWVSVYSGTLNVGESASLLSAGKILALRFADEAGSSSTTSLAIAPIFGGSFTFFLPVAFGSTLTWARLNTNTNTKTLEFVSAGNASLRLKQVMTVL